MNRLRLPPALRKKDEPAAPRGVRDVFQRFFDLIERLERPFHPGDSRPAPEVKARITRLDDKPHRPS
ncbi:MAG: hypothetical protein CFE31_06535 [Rhizobiales bacterium PAR1]|nr:MAG: hypothetical protein CFE31_06535 [Rhizobiales bacterium PAR1]